MEHVDGLNVTNDDGIYPNGQWHSGSYPINGYNWSLDYNNAANQSALKKHTRLQWWDYVLGPSIVIPGIVNILNLKQ